MKEYIAHIIKSYDLVQVKEMSEQIDEFGVYDFLNYLDTSDISFEKKFRILTAYLRTKNR